VYQVNNELQRANVQPAQQEAASRQIVQGLVDRQILLQAAHKEKLDRKPQVMQAIENAKMQILAQAYLQERVASVAKPTADEIESLESPSGVDTSPTTRRASNGLYPNPSRVQIAEMRCVLFSRVAIAHSGAIIYGEARS
jgi:hypothetical protein